MHPKKLTFTLLATLAVFLGGCASDATGVASPSSAARYPTSLTIKVTGGSEAATVSASQSSNPYVTATLIKSLREASLFATLIPPGQSGAEYQLEVVTAPLQPPAIGAEMIATLDANWILTRVSNAHVIWQKNISSSHTTKAKEAFTGIERVQLAIEGAVQANIKDGLTQLGAISLP